MPEQYDLPNPNDPQHLEETVDRLEEKVLGHRKDPMQPEPGLDPDSDAKPGDAPTAEDSPETDEGAVAEPAD